MNNKVFIPFTVDPLSIRKTTNRQVPKDNQNYIYAQFNFNSSWDGLNKIAIFSKENTVTMHVAVVDDICQIPNNFLLEVGNIEISVYAGDRRTVNTATIEVVQSGFKEGIPPLPPEENSIYVQSPNSTVPFIRYENDNFQFFANGIWNVVEGGSGGGGTSGHNGWTPLFAIINDGERNIVRITDWIGGGGTKPSIGYLGITGIVNNISQATNIRGMQGLKGESFNPIDVQRISNLEASVNMLQDETTAKWVLLNDVDNRTRLNTSDIIMLQDTIGTLNITLQDRLEGVI